MSDTLSTCSDEPLFTYFKIAIDFGTTCSSVAYMSMTEPNPRRRVSADEPRLITEFPDSAQNENDLQDQRRLEVPSQCWYGPKPAARGTRKRKLTESVEGIHEFNRELQDHLWKEAGKTYQWGYGVQDYVNKDDPKKEIGVYLHNLKLLLDNSHATEKPREDLKLKMDKLKKFHPFKDDTELIIEYLSQLLKHSRQQLEREANFNDDCQVEFIVCVPAAWKAHATMRMQMAVEAAIQRSKFLNDDHPNIRNLFIISEPEAASICVLEGAHGHIRVGETFIILDAGGGTVDATCYTVACKKPLRLERQETMAEGALCGSSYLNFELGELLRERLTETDFEQPNTNFDQIIENAIYKFEYGLKRNIDVYSNLPYAIYLPGLKKNSEKNFMKDKLYLMPDEWHRIFESCLRGTSNLLLQQIEATRAKSLKLKKVIMIGGFAGSPSLRNHIDKELTRYNLENGTRIKRVTEYLTGTSTMVARGAVLRSLRKDQGPARIIQFSYGFKTDEDYAPDHENPDIRRAHADAKVTLDSVDKMRTVKDTIFWMIQKGTPVPPTWAYRFLNRFVFSIRDKKFECKMDIFMSDEKCESHYQKRHPKNKSAQSPLYLSVDMTFLRDEGLIQPSSWTNPSSNEIQQFWEVKLDLVAKVDGRSLRFEAYWPPMPGDSCELIGEHPGEVKKSCELSIAGAFAHGTA